VLTEVTAAKLVAVKALTPATTVLTEVTAAKLVAVKALTPATTVLTEVTAAKLVAVKALTPATTVLTDVTAAKLVAVKALTPATTVLTDVTAAKLVAVRVDTPATTVLIDVTAAVLVATTVPIEVMLEAATSPLKTADTPDTIPDTSRATVETLTANPPTLPRMSTALRDVRIPKPPDTLVIVLEDDSFIADAVAERMTPFNWNVPLIFTALLDN
jgi:hypothetical protein